VNGKRLAADRRQVFTIDGGAASSAPVTPHRYGKVRFASRSLALAAVVLAAWPALAQVQYDIKKRPSYPGETMPTGTVTSLGAPAQAGVASGSSEGGAQTASMSGGAVSAFSGSSSGNSSNGGGATSVNFTPANTSSSSGTSTSDGTSQVSTTQALEAVRKRRERQLECQQGYVRTDDGCVPGSSVSKIDVASRKISVWATGFADYEYHGEVVPGTNVHRTTTTAGMLAGADIAFQNSLIRNSTVVAGLMGGYSDSSARFSDGSPEAHVYGPSLGVYASYSVERFSTDALLKMDVLEADQVNILPSLNSVAQHSYIAAQNFNYRLPYSSFWVEPTAGYRFFDISYSDGHGVPGQDGQVWRVQGGLRTGQDGLTWHGTLVSWSLTGQLYEDVSSSKFLADPDTPTSSFVTVSPILPSDLNRLRGEAIASVKMDYGNGVSSFAEFNARGGYDMYGLGAKAGIRYSW